MKYLRRRTFRVFMKNEKRDEYDWVNVLFEDYPYWDDAGTAPISLYLIYTALQLLEDKEYYKFLIGKGQHFGLTHESAELFEKEYYELDLTSIKSSRDLKPLEKLIDKYFTRETLVSIGI